MATGDLRAASGVKERAAFTKAIDELQRTFKVIPSEIVYVPKFTYIWAVTEGRFQDELATRSEQGRSVDGNCALLPFQRGNDDGAENSRG